MKLALSCSLSLALLAHVAPSFAAYDFKSIDYPGSTQTIVFAVNDGARMVGQYWDAKNATHAFAAEGTQRVPEKGRGMEIASRSRPL